MRPVHGQADALPSLEDFETKPFVVLRWVRDHCDWPPAVQLCYLYLYSHRSDQGDFTPGIRRLAQKLGASDKVAVEAIRALEKLGAVEVERRQEPGAKEAARNIYRLTPPWEAAQQAERPARGKYSSRAQVTESEEVLPTGQHVLPIGEQVLPNRAEGASVLEAQVLPSGERIEPLPRAIDKSHIDTSSAAPRAERQRARKSSSASEKPPDPHNQMANALVQRLDTWLKAQGVTGVANWGAAIKIAANALKGGRCGAPISLEDADAALLWAQGDQYWRRRLKAAGMTVLRDVWAAWTERHAAPARRGNQYVDHTAEGAHYEDDSGFKRRSV